MIRKYDFSMVLNELSSDKTYKLIAGYFLYIKIHFVEFCLKIRVKGLLNGIHPLYGPPNIKL